MKPHEVIRKIATFKENDNYEEYKDFMESLDLIELTSLHRLSSGIKSFCEEIISNKIK